jgi:3-dehydroquinate dehydratase II
VTGPLYVLNGPNLNLLGKREPGIYGAATLADIEAMARARASSFGLAVEFRQTNHEGTLVDWVQEAGENGTGIVINPGAYTHTSVALHDALRVARCPIVEVHLSNIHAREPFRHQSYVSPVAQGVIIGLGPLGYELAIEAIARLTRADA